MAIERIPVGDRSAWLALRRRDVTASDIAALFGAHPYRTALSVWADKVGVGHDRGDNSAMRRGRILEPAVAAAVAEERPHLVIGKATQYLRDPDLRLGATPDYLAMELDAVTGGSRLFVLECKTADPSVFERDWASGPPMAWMLQALVQAMLLDAAGAIVACMVMSRDLPVHIFDVPRHPAAEARIVERVQAFWQAIEEGTQPPAVDGRDAATLASMFPRDTGAVLDLTGDNLLPEILAERATLQAEIAEREDRKDTIDSEIKAKLGEAAEARLPGWKVTWKTQKRAERVVPAGEYRVLRITDYRKKEMLT